MKTIAAFFAALLLLSSCATTKSQLITLSSDNLKATPAQGLVYDNDTLRLSYEFFSERGAIYLTIENKLAKPLYVDWKRSSFIVGQNKLDYWYDVAAANLYGTAYTNSYARYARNWSSSTTLAVNGTISKDNSVDFIPPGAKLTKAQFVVLPGAALTLPGQYLVSKVASTDTLSKKLVEVQTYQYSADTSPLRFRNYLTLSTDKDFGKDIVVDSNFWASSVQVMPQSQLTGGAFIGPDMRNVSASTLRAIPYYRPDAFFVSYTPPAQ